MTTELLPCPFCGGTNIGTENARDFIACLECGAEGPCYPGQGSPSAMEAWNRRSPTTPTEGPALLTDDVSIPGVRAEPSVAAEPTQPEPQTCEVAPGEFDHDWEFQDDSFDHEFGTERVHYWRCRRCDETKAMESGDYDDE